MSKKRKRGSQAPPQKRSAAAPDIAPQVLPATSQAAPATVDRHGLQPDPPRKYMLFLVITAVALSIWFSFLVAMAVYG